MEFLQRRLQAVPATAWSVGFGVFVALWLYGWRAIDPRSHGWLLHGDAGQHFLGASFFLSQAWHWPPGRIEGFGYTPTSVVFADAIPLLALPLKLLGWPAQWQYLGAWMAACHVLAAWQGARLVQALGAPPAAAALGGCFFAVMPTVLARAYGHEALMGQFIVLAAIVQVLRPWSARMWLLVAGLAVGVHAYLAFMAGVLWLTALGSAVRNGELGRAKALRHAAAMAALVLLLAFTAGYFGTASDVSAGGYGFFSANLTTWFNPTIYRDALADPVLRAHARDWSAFLPGWHLASGGQWEGFAYLGLGAIVALLAAACIALARRELPSRRVRVLAGVCVAMACVAVSHQVTFGTLHLLDIPLAGPLPQLLGVVRASGRFIWPLTFLAMAAAIAGVGRMRFGRALLAALLVLQLADLAPKLRELQDRFRNGAPEVERAAQSPLWQELLANCPHLVLVTDAMPDHGWIVPALEAARARASFAPAPVARFTGAMVNELQRRSADVLAGVWREDTVYVLFPPLPGGRNAAGVLDALPVGLVHAPADGRELVFAPRCAPAQPTASSSTSNFSVAFGGMTPPAPRAP